MFNLEERSRAANRRLRVVALLFALFLLLTLSALVLVRASRTGMPIPVGEGEGHMKPLPETEDVLVLRTDFSDQWAWWRICAAVQAPEPVHGFRAYVECLEDEAYEGVTLAQLLQLVPADYNHGFIFLVDEATISSPESPLLVVDLFDEPGRSFRAIPGEIWGIENNLSLANMDWEEFADHVDEDGVFRGYDE